MNIFTKVFSEIFHNDSVHSRTEEEGVWVPGMTGTISAFVVVWFDNETFFFQDYYYFGIYKMKKDEEILTNVTAELGNPGSVLHPNYLHNLV